MNNLENISLMTLVIPFLMMSFVYASQKERIAVAADKKMLDAAVSSQAGRSSFFLLFDDKGTFLEAIVNPYTDVKSRGIAIADLLAGRDTSVVVAEGFGTKFIEYMDGKVIKAFAFKGSAREAVKNILQYNGDSKKGG